MMGLGWYHRLPPEEREIIFEAFAVGFLTIVVVYLFMVGWSPPELMHL